MGGSGWTAPAMVYGCSADRLRSEFIGKFRRREAGNLWKSLRRSCEAAPRLKPAIQKLTEGERARVANRLRKEDAEANLVRKREEAEDQARQNQKIRLLY